MQKSITWFYLFIKKQCRQWETWIICGCMLICLVIISHIQKPATDNLNVGFCICDDGKLAEQMKDILLSADSIFQFYESENEEELQNDIRRGTVFCGFVIEEGFEEKLQNEEQKNMITYVCLQETVRGRVARETVYSEFLRLLSEEIIRKEGVQFAGKKNSSEFVEKALENNKMYLDGDKLFDIDYVDVKGNENKELEKEQASETYPVEGLFVSFLFLGILLVNEDNRYKNKKILQLMTTTDGIRFRIAQYLAFGCVIGVVGEGCLMFIHREWNWKVLMIGLTGAMLLSILWAFVVNWLFAKDTTYYVWMVTILLFHILLSPVFFQISDYIPVLRWLQWGSPIGFYLRIMELFAM